ncbi:LysR family transcriptional regulator [Enterovibrio norvegicus]|uniref:LysR family transcriptional regulator n=1 Tax=Enterovibrio norvegicus TaxID=188144 RepID=A0A2N7L3W4_9GAMM|nr:LysR family transcriptional regulator [Enterovibrio norvegicus]PMN88035.1 LysR family transcriptional regulator [Enterovibrio norvegicus]
MLSHLDLNLLKVFVAVYRHQSITMAAEEMGLTQPGVSGLLKRLQQQVGSQLFVRSGRGIAPTQHAQTLMTHVEPALIQISNALEGLNGFSTEHPRKFIIYTSEPVMMMLLPKIEADDSLGNVRIELQPTLSNEEKLITGLNQHQADMAIEFANYSTRSFFTEDLFEDGICVIARKGHPRIDGAISQAQFYDEKHITLKLRREDAYLADYFTKERLDDRQVAAECTSLVSQLSMVSNSDCIATMTASIASLFAERLNIQILDIPFTVHPIRYRLMVHNRERNSPSNIWLREKIASYFVV